MADAASVLGLLFTTELFLILGLMVMNTYFLTRPPVLQHLREIYFISSPQFRRAWYLVIAAMSVFLFLQGVDVFVQAGRLNPSSGVRELFLVVFATLVIAAFVEIVQIFERYIPRLGSDDKAIVERIRFDMRRHLLDRDADGGDLLPSTADVYRGRDVLGPYVSIAHYRGVVLGMTKYLERRYGQLGDALLYAVGRQTASTVARDLVREVGASAALDQFLDALRTAHVGLPVVQELGPTARRIVLNECAICCGMPVESGGAQCHYLTGLFTGLYEVLWDRRVETREVRCWALGDHVCEFEVLPGPARAPAAAPAKAASAPAPPPAS